MDQGDGAWGVHFCSSIERSSNDKRVCDTVDGICECARIGPVFESDLLRPHTTGANNDGQDEEDTE